MAIFDPVSVTPETEFLGLTKELLRNNFPVLAVASSPLGQSFLAYVLPVHALKTIAPEKQSNTQNTETYFGAAPRRVSSLFLLLFLSQLCLGQEEQRFWTPSEQKFESEKWRVYQPSSEKLKNQGFLIYANLPGNSEAFDPRDVLIQLYSELDDFHLLGKKTVEWQGSPATIMSFSGEKDDKTILGRSLLSQKDGKAELLLLVRRPKSDPRLLKEFEKSRASWPELLQR